MTQEWIDIKYAGLLSSKLTLYKVRNNNPYTAQFRCPICGDSKKNKHKCRGNIYTSKGGLFYKCFNCNYSSNVGNLIKQIDPYLYKQYVMERYSEGVHGKAPHKKVEDVFSFDHPFKEHTRFNGNALEQLCKPIKGTPAEEYCEQRKIPIDKRSSLLYIDKLDKLEVLGEKYKDKIVYDDARLVIPFYDKANRLIGATCRALESHPVKYYTIRLIEDVPMIYNINNVQVDSNIYVTEGPLDSLFIDNCISVSSTNLKVVENYLPKDKIVLIYDNQPRNKEVVEIIEKAIDYGFSLMIWPNDVNEKDINEFILSNDIDIQQFIRDNTFSGLSLAMKFKQWKKIK